MKNPWRLARDFWDGRRKKRFSSLSSGFGVLLRTITRVLYFQLKNINRRMDFFFVQLKSINPIWPHGANLAVITLNYINNKESQMVWFTFDLMATNNRSMRFLVTLGEKKKHFIIEGDPQEPINVIISVGEMHMVENIRIKNWTFHYTDMHLNHCNDNNVISGFNAKPCK